MTEHNKPSEYYPPTGPAAFPREGIYPAGWGPGFRSWPVA
jgi:hypothetical protein